MSEKQMTCKELVELVTAYLEGALDADAHALFDAHLVYCDGCRNYLEQFRATVRTIGKIQDYDLDPTFRSRLLDAFKDFR